ncbi:MAG: DUF4167 domain-containing protein [Rhodobiaceae bacterium]|nr:DUF4167 domain-containing protein [Rhodobiaceae bacterium]
MKRSRGRGRRQQNSVNRSYDSNGPDVRVRGNASQVYEKYQTLARDAMSSGDRVMAENYQQHAEHYYRILMSMQPAPSEANGEAASHETQNTNTNAGADGVANGNSDAPEADASGEPLVLVREASTDGASDGKSSKPSRRRGPLRKKPPQGGEPDASQANGGVVQANGSVEAVEVIAEPAPDSALEAGETETLSAE